MTVKA